MKGETGTQRGLENAIIDCWKLSKPPAPQSLAKHIVDPSQVWYKAVWY